MSRDNARRLPHSAEIERSLLGGLLLDPSQLADVSDALGARDLHRPHHAALFTLLTDLATGGGYDLATVLDRVAQDPDPSRYGGVPYVVALPNACPSVESISLYAGKLRDLAAKRKLLLASWATIDAAEDPAAGADQLIGDAAERLASVSTATRTGARWEHIAPIASKLIVTIEERWVANEDAKTSGAPPISGISTGFRDLDRLTSGLQPEDLIVLAARPAAGKTSLALAIATAAARSSRDVGILSLEMSKAQLVQRMLSVEALVDATRLRSGDLDRDLHWPRLHDGIESLTSLPMHFDDDTAVTMATIRARTIRLKRDRPALCLLVVDYLQLIDGARGEIREQAIAAISRGLKKLAKELKITIIALSQLNRDLEKRADKRPMMSDLRESGAIEQDADTIIFIYRDEVYNPDTPDRGVAELIIAKQRSGPIGTVKLAFTSAYTRFSAYQE